MPNSFFLPPLRRSQPLRHRKRESHHSAAVAISPPLPHRVPEVTLATGLALFLPSPPTADLSPEVVPSASGYWCIRAAS